LNPDIDLIRTGQPLFLKSTIFDWYNTTEEAASGKAASSNPIERRYTVMTPPPDHRSKRTIMRYMIVAAKLIAAIGSLIAAITALVAKLR
jgi:hypothetical protein